MKEPVDLFVLWCRIIYMSNTTRRPKVNIARLERPVHAGDWHDAPSRWEAAGPANERQIFSTRKEAEKYARIRRRSADFTTAVNTFIATA